jgi:multicomponent Na+:H+ antiporter subunit B
MEDFMPVETWLTFILGFMVLGSIIALELKDILSAIIAIGIVGLGVSIAFLLLQAPDLAIVQFLFEIIALIILVRAFLGKKTHAEIPAKSNIFLTTATILILVAVLVLSIPILKQLPPFGQPLMNVSQYYLDNGAAETGSANLVAPIVLDYRGYDTFGEITILFTAVVGAIAVLRIKSKKEKES